MNSEDFMSDVLNEEQSDAQALAFGERIGV